MKKSTRWLFAGAGGAVLAALVSAYLNNSSGQRPAAPEAATDNSQNIEGSDNVQVRDNNGIVNTGTITVGGAGE
ncbi:MAG: hypothetical protein AB3N24_21795 [Leisingera sp.]